MTATTTPKASSRSARFYGECQLCGHEQKLPNDLLSLHGYSVKWNCFVGTCPGSRAVPFEISKDLVEGAIARSIESAKNLRANAAKIRADLNPKDVEMAVYAGDLRRASDGKRLDSWAFSSTFGTKGSSVTVRGDLSKVGDEIEFRFTRNGVEYFYRMGLSRSVYATTTVEEIVEKLRASEADGLLALAKQHDSYVTWQRGRIANWQPQPLREVPESERGSKATVHFTWNRSRLGIYCRFSSYSGNIGAWSFISSKDWSKVTCSRCLAAKAKIESGEYVDVAKAAS